MFQNRGGKKSLGPFKQTNTQYMTLGTHGQEEATCILLLCEDKVKKTLESNVVCSLLFLFGIFETFKLSFACLETFTCYF
jgi:hypothetical protein